MDRVWEVKPEAECPFVDLGWEGAPGLTMRCHRLCVHGSEHPSGTSILEEILASEWIQKCEIHK
jgi:hypothetical protein